MWESISEYCGGGMSAFSRLIMSFDRREWTYVLFAVMAWGAFCMRGFGKRL